MELHCTVSLPMEKRQTLTLWFQVDHFMKSYLDCIKSALKHNISCTKRSARSVIMHRSMFQWSKFHKKFLWTNCSINAHLSRHKNQWFTLMSASDTPKSKFETTSLEEPPPAAFGTAPNLGLLFLGPPSYIS